MKRTRPGFSAALVALAAMLFAQAAFALAACDAARMPSRAEILAQSGEHAPCHEPADNVNLCLAHCQNAEQTLDKHQVKVHSLPAAPVLETPTSPHGPRTVAWAPRTPCPAAGPPARILYRSFLI